MHTGTLLPALALCTLAVAKPADPRAVGADEARILRAAEDATLAELRAGAIAAPGAIPSVEREALRAAEARSPDLAAMRAGHIEISDDEFKVIAIVLAVVLILVII